MVTNWVTNEDFEPFPCRQSSISQTWHNKGSDYKIKTALGNRWTCLLVLPSAESLSDYIVIMGSMVDTLLDLLSNACYNVESRYGSIPSHLNMCPLNATNHRTLCDISDISYSHRCLYVDGNSQSRESWSSARRICKKSLCNPSARPISLSRVEPIGQEAFGS
jgi:hypothetical protein